MSDATPNGWEGRVAATRWYHTLDLPGGITTPGTYDLRPILDRLPIPTSLAGARCLDIGSRDGFYAFEMERRGAREVVSVDIERAEDIHFPFPPPAIAATQREIDDGNRAFALARDALGSQVARVHRSIYDLSSEQIGTFDFAVIGTLLLHLRDPVRALSAAGSVISGRLLLNDPVTLGLTALHRRRPVAELLMRGGPFWWGVNAAGQRRLLAAAGFRVVASGRPYLVPAGRGSKPEPLLSCLRRPLADAPRRLSARRGAIHAWALAEPIAAGAQTLGVASTAA